MGDEKPLRGGVFRGRLVQGLGRAAVGVAEDIFAPARHEGRRQREERARLADPVPAPTDPPDLTPTDTSGAAPYAARITLRRPAPQQSGTQRPGTQR